MKRICYLLVNICLSLQLNATPVVLVDTIVAIVSNAAGTEIITQSDLDRPTLFGQYRSIEECELQKAIELEAKRHKIDVDDAMVESYLDSVQQAYHITRKDIEQMFIDAGYTVTEGIEQLRTSQITNIIVQREVYENISVSLQEVRIHCEIHPEYKQAEYIVERSVVEKEQIDHLQRYPEQIVFSNPITLQESEISFDHEFITKMHKGEIRFASIDNNRTEIIRLDKKIDERLLTVDERYDHVASILQKEKYDKLFSQFKQRLLQSVSIIHL